MSPAFPSPSSPALDAALTSSRRPSTGASTGASLPASLRFSPWLLLLLPSLALAGELRGVVALDGAAPALQATPVGKDASSCGTEQPDPSVRIGAGGKLADVVVYLALPPGFPRPAAVQQRHKLDQQGCRFYPHVIAARQGDLLVAENSDPVFHNVRGTLGGKKTTFNVVMPRKGQQSEVALTTAGVIRAQCDAGHPWMSAYLHVFDHPYFAVSGADGAYRLTGIPAGRYTLRAIHERFGEQAHTVVVPAEGVATFDLTVRAAAVEGK